MPAEVDEVGGWVLSLEDKGELEHMRTDSSSVLL